MMTIPNFPDCLNTALAQSGKSLAQVEFELRAKGFRINKSTLNRWCNGRTKPRRDKLALLRYIPDLLEMPPAMRLTFNRLVRQMVGGHMPAEEMGGGVAGRRNYLGGRVVYFTGRSPEMNRLKASVKKRQPVLITGLGGVGKTSLARKLLEEMAGEFTFGCDAISLKADQTPVAIVEQVARRLGAPMSLAAVGQDIDLAVQELKVWADNIDLLFLLDDVQESAQIRYLLAELPDITWVITSRRKLFLPFEAVEVALTPPSDEEAVSMLHHYSNVPANLRNQAITRQIVARLDSLPIAIRAAGGLVQTGRLPNLSSLLEWLKVRGLDGVRLEDWSLTGFLAGMLEMVELPGRDLFALCGVFPTRHIDAAVFTLLAEELAMPTDSLGELANLSLIEWQADEGQFYLHPLIHEYAGRYLANHPRHTEMSLTFAAFYAGFATEFRGQYPRLEPELSQLTAAAEVACEANNWRLLQPLWQVVTGTLWRLSDWTTYWQFDEKCLKVAQHAGERQVESLILSELGWILLEERKWEEADQYFQEAQFIVDDLTSTEQSVRLRRYRAILFRERGQLDNAAVLLAEAEHLVESTSEMVHWAKRSRDKSLALISHAYAGLARAAGDYETAIRRERQSLAYCENPDCLSYRPMFDLQLGDLYYLQDDLDQAGCIWQLIMRHGWRYQPEQRIIAAAFLRMAQLAACRNNRERALGWAYRAEQLYQASGLAEKARQAGVLAEGLDQLISEQPAVWPAFELWD
jgi:hypothetical protein